MKSMNCVVLCGPIGAGKSTVANYLATTYGVRNLSFVENIWHPILADRGLPVTRANLQSLGIELMRDRGPEGLVDDLLALGAPEAWHAIDDVRDVRVYHYLRSRVNRLVGIYLDTEFDVRFGRLVIRDGVRTPDEQRNAETISTELGIPALRDIVDYKISNRGDIDDLSGQVDAVAISLGLERIH